MEPRALEVGEIVQINPYHRDDRDRANFGGCLMVVQEPKSWGAQGYVLIPGAGAAYYRCSFKAMEATGAHAPWVLTDNAGWSDKRSDR